MNINKAQIAGRLGKDPELKSLPSGVSVVTFSVASSRNWKDKQTGEKKEETEWHNVVFFGRRAEVIAQYFGKGQEIYVSGRIKTRSWESDGQKKYRTEIVGEDFQFVGSKSESSPKSNITPEDHQPKEELHTIEYPEEDINPDEIPF